MYKGGYKIIDFKRLNLVAGSKTTIKGIHECIENNYNKPLLLTGLKLDGVDRIDVFCSYTVTLQVFSFDVYGYTITVDASDAVLATKKA